MKKLIIDNLITLLVFIVVGIPSFCINYILATQKISKYKPKEFTVESVNEYIGIVRSTDSITSFCMGITVAAVVLLICEKINKVLTKHQNKNEKTNS